MTQFFEELYAAGEFIRKVSHQAQQYLTPPISPPFEQNKGDEGNKARNTGDQKREKRAREDAGEAKTQTEETKKPRRGDPEFVVWAMGHCEGCNASHRGFRDSADGNHCKLSRHPDFCKEGKWAESEKGKVYKDLNPPVLSLPTNSRLDPSTRNLVKREKGTQEPKDGSRTQMRQQKQGIILAVTQPPMQPIRITQVLVLCFIDKTGG